MAFAAGRNVLRQFLDALGIRGDHYRGLTISVQPDEVVTVTLVKYPERGELNAVAELLTNSGGQVVVNEVVVPDAAALASADE